MNRLSLLLAPFVLATGLALAQSTTKPAMSTVNCANAMKSKININAAKLEVMRCLPGFSDKIAKDVIANRPFKDGNDFKKKIEDIGPILWKNIEKYVVFK
jgi:DNA uptake protein ComE-like DNA-binding protein